MYIIGNSYLYNENILITGGSGYLGGRIAYYFSSMKNINVIQEKRNMFFQVMKKLKFLKLIGIAINLLIN